MKKTFTILVFCVTLCMLSCAQGAFEDPSVKFYEANLSYKQGDYHQAAIFYEEILGQGIVGGALYYNLGNSYFKLQQLGKSILNYERAKLFIPRDSDLQANLDYALSLSPQKPVAQEVPFVERIIRSYQDMFTAREMMWISVLFCVVLGIVVIFAEAFRLSFNKRWVVVTFVAVLVFGQVSIWINKSHDLVRTAVILGDTQARFEPKDQATEHFRLIAGEKVFVIRIEGDWAKVKRFDGKIGWINVSAFEKLLSRSISRKGMS
ncbi:MAG TPA: hypothetical protein PLO93_06635 [Candidatus Omnitrophota bacterium]|nr:hypothetical protein [Candidatus Omnitrophota bacterium]HQL41949.1 hypothetical protein [Candidatus Omnitrophota bacterium]